MAEREAINTGPQAGVADIMRGVMIQLENHPRLNEIDAHLLLQIHDEVVMEGPRENQEEIANIIVDVMENPFREYDDISFNLPWKIDVGVSDVWKKA